MSYLYFFFTTSDQKEIYIGDDNPLTLEVTAENRGEGAYEAELHVFIPPQADFTGVVRNSEVYTPLMNCDGMGRLYPTVRYKLLL